MGVIVYQPRDSKLFALDVKASQCVIRSRRLMIVQQRVPIAFSVSSFFRRRYTRIKTAFKKRPMASNETFDVVEGLPERAATATRIAFVGDVHDQWSEDDEDALRRLQPDLTVFVGDIGNEAVDLVQEISKLDLPKAVILGNHDAFFTQRPMKRESINLRYPVDPVNAQLSILGDDHIGFSSKAVPNKPVTIVGARPFSGGGVIKNPQVVENTFGYKPEEYTEAIAKVALSASEDHAIVIVGHNGPTGLGDRRFDICGVDFREEEGDFGDQDLRDALEHLKNCERSPVLVVFGHMHNRLNRRFGGGFRRRLVFDDETNTLFFNVAVVPRVVGTRNALLNKNKLPRRHHFSLVDILDGNVIRASDAWLSKQGDDNSWRVQDRVLFQRSSSDSTTQGGDEIEIHDTHLDQVVRRSIA